MTRDRTEPTGGVRTTSWTEVVALYVMSITFALVLSALLVEATGGSAGTVVEALVDGSLMSPARWGRTMAITVPILLVALGTIVSTRASLVNIGQEGQLLIGAACGAYISVHLGNNQQWPGPVVLVAIILAGVVGGAAWAGLAALLRYKRNVPEVLSTLLLIAIASQVVAYALRRESLLLAPLGQGQGTQTQHTLPVPESARMPSLEVFGNDVSLSVLLALFTALVVSFALARTIWGFRLTVLGHNARVAQRSGISTTRYGGTALLISGAFAGLAGAVMLVGGDFGNYRFSAGFVVNIGWTGLLVALVSRGRVLPAVFIAFTLACLRTGSGFLAATGVERRITDVVQALLILALLIPPAVLYVRERRRTEAALDSRDLS
jgi:ABC-type uncharacterized transport system permease subunit